MSGEVWGTFSVRDHCLPNAFVSDLLLYDRLVIPVPADGKEWDRWRRPNPKKPGESWDPDRLKRLLEMLGTQHEPGKEGARLVWTVPWSEEKWQYERSRLEATGIVSDDAFYATRRIVAQDEEVPAVVEAVTAYPSAGACVGERGLRRLGSVEAPDEVAALLARPLLLPTDEEDADLHPLRQTIELATDPAFIAARDAYYAWVREFLEPLQKGNRNLDPASLKLAEEKLETLISQQREVVERYERRKRWRWAKQAFAVVGIGAGGVAALQAGGIPEVVGAAAGVLGWIAGRVGAPPPDRPPLTGASMFVAAEQGTGWLPQR